MDEIKLTKWIRAFQLAASKLSIEYNALFVDKSLEDSYELQLNHSCDELSLVIKEKVPEQIKDRLMKILIETKPEDSV